jgi:Protein of unknown function (DUF3105)
VSKGNKNRDRRAVVEQMQREAKAAERKRTLTVVAVCVTVALVIVGLAVYQVLKDKQAKDRLAAQQLTDIGASATAAGCTPIQQKDARGQGQHTLQKVIYDTVPPAYGPHNPTPDSSGKHFFTAAERPPLEVLVHNLEHGWTIVWYDESIASNDAAMQSLKDTAAKFDAHGRDPRYNMIIAPWTKSDGEGQPIPDGKHIAFTHWSIHQPVYTPPTSSKQPASFGELQFCSSFSGAALSAFMKKFPYDDAPEGFLWHQ